MKLWIDDIRPAPEGYIWVKSVNEAKKILSELLIYTPYFGEDFVVDLDHDAGNYAKDGGDYIKLLDWLELTDLNDTTVIGDMFMYHIHSMNSVGVENMRRIIRKNGWKEV